MPDEIGMLSAQIAQLEANVREIREFMGKQGQAIMELSKRGPMAGKKMPERVPDVKPAEDGEAISSAYRRGYADGLAVGRRLT